MHGTFSPRVRLGPYELLLDLASGGMASVILAIHRGAAGFERLVVVKRVHRRHLDNQEFRHMFRDEARLASSIRHANVAGVIDVIESEGELCLVMEYFESLSLASLVRAASDRNLRLSPAVASRILSDTLAGLHAAHEAADIRRHRLGIVHRDVSPQNIIVDTGGVSRVIDFGIAKAETRITHTKSGFVKGKLGYMSPEQVEALPVDRRSDLFSTAVVLFETLSGRPLFSTDDEFETMRKVLAGDLPDLREAISGLSSDLETVLRKALSRAPADRFQTALLFQEALERAAPPAPAHEVGALVTELARDELVSRHDKLLSMLGEELEKISPRSSSRTKSPLTKGNTLPLRIAGVVPPSDPRLREVDPIGPTLRDLPIVSAHEGLLPAATLKSAGETSGSVPASQARASPKGSMVPMIAVGVLALFVGLVATFFALRPGAAARADGVPSAAVVPSASARAPSTPAPSEEPAPRPVVPSAPVSAPAAKKSPPAPAVAAPTASHPKPPRPLLAPNPYDDSK
jgi:eukaryotic-like serine/threonine-protein kinase